MKAPVTFTCLSIILLAAALGSGQDSVECHVWGGVVNGSTGPCQPPKLTRATPPGYPDDAIKKGIEGTVVVEILIDADGRVAKARILMSIPALDQAAIACVKEWQFTPATIDGHPVATVARAPVRFRLPNASGRAQQTQEAPDIRLAGPTLRAEELQTALLEGPGIPLAMKGFSARRIFAQTDGLAQHGASRVPGTAQRLGAPSFDPQGADFSPWLDRFRIEIYDHWLLPSAYGAWHSPKPVALGYHGRVDFEFIVERDGRVSSSRMLSSSATPVLEAAARSALLGSQFPGLPLDYGPPRATMRVAFSYEQKADDSDPIPMSPKQTPSATLSPRPAPK